MKFSEFIYNIVKVASDYGDESMNYQSFLLGNMSKDEDYSKFLDKAFFQANSFFRRIASLDKLPYKNFSITLPSGIKTVELPDDCLKVVAVVKMKGEGYVNYQFKQYKNNGIDKVLVLDAPKCDNALIIQYQRSMPYFKKSDIHFITELIDNNGNASYDVDGGEICEDIDEAFAQAENLQIDLTKEYELPEEALYLGVDWCVGRLNEDKSQGHSQEMEAETRLNDLLDDPFLFSQKQSGGNRV